MAAKKTKQNDAVVVLSTHTREPLTIRANPSDEEVQGFVSEHNRRYAVGEPGGPSGIQSRLVLGAKRYTSEAAFLDGADPVAEIDISEFLPTP